MLLGLPWVPIHPESFWDSRHHQKRYYYLYRYLSIDSFGVLPPLMQNNIAVSHYHKGGLCLAKTYTVLALLCGKPDVKKQMCSDAYNEYCTVGSSPTPALRLRGLAVTTHPFQGCNAEFDSRRSH